MYEDDKLNIQIEKITMDEFIKYKSQNYNFTNEINELLQSLNLLSVTYGDIDGE